VYIRLAELVRGGVLGKLRHVEVRLPPGKVGFLTRRKTTIPPPISASSISTPME
jgi:hypothetical protein